MEVLVKSFEELFNLKEPVIININVTSPTINIDHSVTNNNDNTTNNVTNNTPPKVEELRQCTKCKWNKPLDNFYSTAKTGMTKQCQKCRDIDIVKHNTKKENIKRSMVNNDSEKTCMECGLIKSKDEFISFVNSGETRLCVKCRGVKTRSHYCEHNKHKINCAVCNPTGSIVHLYRSNLARLINNKCSKDYRLEHLGCDRQTLIDHIESQFDRNINWDNYTTYWELDHILPLMEINEGDYIPWDEIERRMHYTNIRPLSITENKSKSNKKSPSLAD